MIPTLSFRPAVSVLMASAVSLAGALNAYARPSDLPAPDVTEADAFVTALADKHIREKAASSKIVYIDGRPDSEAQRSADTDSLRVKVVEYYYDQFRNSLDPDMPYFLFMSKGADMTLGLGGGVRMRAFYDWRGAMLTNAFNPSQIAIPTDPASPRKFNATASGSYVNMIMIGHHDKIGDYGLYIEGEFTGYQGVGFKLNKSYARVRDFTFGYATSSFCDPMAEPAIVDAAGTNNKISYASVLARWMPRINRHWLAAVSAETPRKAIDETGLDTRPVSNWLPDAAAFLQYEWGPAQHVRLSGIVRSLSYLTVSDSKRHNLAGWAVQLSSVANPGSRLTTYATVSYGRGYGGLGGDLAALGSYDLVGDPGNPGRLYAPALIGWNAALKWNFRPDLFTQVTASKTHYMPRKGTAPDEYKSGTFLAASVFWSILPRLTVAAEYDWGMRRNDSGIHKSACRANLTAMFTF